MDWLGDFGGWIGLVSGLLAIAGAGYKRYQARRQSAIFSLVVKSKSGDPLAIDLTNTGKQTIYRVSGKMEFFDAGSEAVMSGEFFALRVAEGEGIPLQIAASRVGDKPMSFSELSGIARYLVLSVKFQLNPRSLRRARRTIRIGVAALAQERPILPNGDFL